MSVPFVLVLRRSAAYLIDVVVIFGGFVSTQSLVLAPVRDRTLRPGWMRSGPALEGYVLLTVSLPAWLYFALCESSGRRATPGKRLFGLQVSGLHGEQIGLGRALLRAVGKMLPWEISHLIVNLPTPMWIDPASGEMTLSASVSRQRAGLFAAVYALLGIYLAVALRKGGAVSLHDLVAQTRVRGA